MQGSYTNLKAWQFGYTLALEIYQSINTFPSNEKFGLISQMQRSAVSIPCNIAEGYARISQKEKIQFYSISRGSVAELQTQLQLAKDIGYMDIDTYIKLQELSATVYKLLNALIKTIRASI